LQAPPRSLATTCGISVDFFSSGYLDVSVHRVRSTQAMYSLGSDPQQMVLHHSSHPSKARLLFQMAFNESHLFAHAHARLLFQMAFNESHLLRAGFPHSEICGSKLVCQLPAAFRRLQRLSSPVIAKASIICTYSLDPITLSPQSVTDQGRYKCCSVSRLCQAYPTKNKPG
jgi:hypothetical protein